MLGIVAAVATVGFVVFRLADAAGPVPTGIVLSSESAALVSVQSLQVEGQDVLPQGWAPSSVAEAEPGRSKPQAVAGLRVGRPASIKAVMAAPRSVIAVCTLEPRPYGACIVRARFMSGTDLRCEFECKTEPRKP